MNAQAHAILVAAHKAVTEELKKQEPLAAGVESYLEEYLSEHEEGENPCPFNYGSSLVLSCFLKSTGYPTPKVMRILRDVLAMRNLNKRQWDEALGDNLELEA